MKDIYVAAAGSATAAEAEAAPSKLGTSTHVTVRPGGPQPWRRRGLHLHRLHHHDRIRPEAVTDVVITDGKHANGYSKNGVSFQSTGLDLNQHAGGGYLWLLYTHDPKRPRSTARSFAPSASRSTAPGPRTSRSGRVEQQLDGSEPRSRRGGHLPVAPAAGAGHRLMKPGASNERSGETANVQDVDLIKVVSMPEGLAASGVGSEAAGHAEHVPHARRIDRHQRILAISEAILLSRWSRWSPPGRATRPRSGSTESSVRLAESATAQTTANRETYAALDLRNFDASTFNTWFSAYAVGNKPLMAVAARRFRPAFRVAFDVAGDQRPRPARSDLHAAVQAAGAGASEGAGRASDGLRRGGEGGRTVGRLRARRSSWPACSSWSGSARRSPCVACATRWWGSEASCC